MGSGHAGRARDYVLWLQRATKPRRAPRTISAARAGTTNAITGKEYLDDRYWPRLALSLVKLLRERHVEQPDGDTIADGRTLSAVVDPSALVVLVPCLS